MLDTRFFFIKKKERTEEGPARSSSSSLSTHAASERDGVHGTMPDQPRTGRGQTASRLGARSTRSKSDRGRRAKAYRACQGRDGDPPDPIIHLPAMGREKLVVLGTHMNAWPAALRSAPSATCMRAAHHPARISNGQPTRAGAVRALHRCSLHAEPSSFARAYSTCSTFHNSIVTVVH